MYFFMMVSRSYTVPPIPCSCSVANNDITNASYHYQKSCNEVYHYDTGHTAFRLMMSMAMCIACVPHGEEAQQMSDQSSTDQKRSAGHASSLRTGSDGSTGHVKLRGMHKSVRPTCSVVQSLTRHTLAELRERTVLCPFPCELLVTALAS